jgi:hypothetical protein
MKSLNDTQKQFIAKLISVSANAKPNVNGTMFRNATVEFPNINGELVTRQAIVYDNNFAYGMIIGNEYLTTATKTADGVIITMSHLVGAETATAEDFGF